MSLKEFVFIEVNAKQPQTTPTGPPDDLVIEFPPTFDLYELGAKVRNGQGKDTRKPPNAFILFRKKYLDALHRRGQRIPMKRVSGWARDAWNLLPHPQKVEYENIATRAASLYQEWAPHTPTRRSHSNRSTKPLKRSNHSKPNHHHNSETPAATISNISPIISSPMTTTIATATIQEPTFIDSSIPPSLDSPRSSADESADESVPELKSPEWIPQESSYDTDTTVDNIIYTYDRISDLNSCCLSEYKSG
ncbi:hypothetical protein Glove_363g38 [Diversispora epigaea]|uniref:HMG box domain-containing protein n=1 Tax=Diversispora epigaea TaxID=1348612 RepID=A0A397HC00_9GLOM|nr:hypothetical protein Glove_363g38 [Diversispora epigaea]